MIIIAGIAGIIEPIGRDLYLDGNAWGSILYIGGTIVEIFGWIGMRHFFLQIPDYNELEWRSGLDELHVVMAESGLSLYHRTFGNFTLNDLSGDLKVTMNVPEPAEHYRDSDLIAGGLVGIRTMLSEIAKTKGSLETIQVGNRDLIFKQGKYIFVLLLANKNLGVYHSILMDLARQIEESNPRIANFNGDLMSLNIAPIVDHYFGLNRSYLN